MKAFGIYVASLVLWVGIATGQTTNVIATVSGNAEPWQWVNGGLNTAYQYFTHEEIDPPNVTGASVINGTDGFRFSVGDNLTISYLSGLVSSSWFSGTIYDAGGRTNSPLNNSNSVTGVAPSYYMNPSTYPIYVVELVGTFADSNGQIVGTPFAIGDLGTFTVPSGATQLQLGVNDNEYSDNGGSWDIQISGPATVPEPTTTALVLVSVVVLGLPIYRSYTHH